MNKRRRFNDDLKAKIALEALRGYQRSTRKPRSLKCEAVYLHKISNFETSLTNLKNNSRIFIAK